MSEIVPVYINNFNRLDPIKELLKAFDRMHEVTPLKVTIVDNASFYQPLLDWYKEITLCTISIFRTSMESFP